MNVITRLRKQHKETQVNLAEAIGVTPAALCRWEKGNRAVSLYALRKIAQHYGITLDELLAMDRKEV